MVTISCEHIDFILSDNGFLLREDVLSWGDWYGNHSFFANHNILISPQTQAEAGPDYLIQLFDKLFLIFPEFRSLVDYRISSLPHLRQYKADHFRRATELHIQCSSIGPRFRIQHGQNTYVLAQEIGSDFWVNHNVTIGSNHGVPRIGNRVTVRTGAVVVGPIFVADDCIVTANAVVARDMPIAHIAYAPQTLFKARSIKNN